jgi:hypothetical protein
MKAVWIKHATVGAAFVLLLALAAGCSSNSPASPTNAGLDEGSSVDDNGLNMPPVGVEGVVEVIIPEKSLFMLADSHFEVYVLDETRAIVQPDGRESILDLDQKFLTVGDFVRITGYTDRDGFYRAELVEIWQNQQPYTDRAIQ